ncbi:hypothetical protein [uncultured Abyssibacter sp.]|uniref:outer membrane beta-barrel protein n=1 Tax=uncultured Abyssibacter sp. TaxID=2320202 RepID=UPI0032B22FC0
MLVHLGKTKTLMLAAAAATGLLVSGTASAEWYAGVRAGQAIVDKGSRATTNELRLQGEPNVTADVDDSDTGGTIYGGIRLGDVIGFEVGLFTLGSHDTVVSGTTTDTDLLARRTAAVQPRAGDGINIAATVFTPQFLGGFEGRLRYGFAYWEAEFETTTSAGTRTYDDDGFDVLAGAGLWYAGFGQVAIGADVDFYNIDDDTVFLLTGGIEWRP